MKWAKSAAQYIAEHGRVCALFGIQMAALFGVYALYGLPLGPALYVALLMAAFFVAAALWGFRRWCADCWQLEHARRQLEQGVPPTLPAAIGKKERLYQSALQASISAGAEQAERAEKGAAQARQYYTLWSHQVKTPLAAMRLMLQEPQPDVQALQQELWKTEQYVDMALQYQRLEGGKDLVLRTLPLESVVKQAVKRVAPIFIHKKLSLTLGNLQAQVLTDEKWLVFVLEQLLTNAVKYTREGGVAVGLVEGGGLVLAVEDTGIGIRPEDLPRVCEWGYTGFNGRTGQQSTGIGLALCSQVMALLGNSMRLESQLGKGTCVLLDLQRQALDVRE